MLTVKEVLEQVRPTLEELGFKYFNNNYTFDRTKNNINDVFEFNYNVRWMRFIGIDLEKNIHYDPEVFLKRFKEEFTDELRLLKIKKIKRARLPKNEKLIYDVFDKLYVEYVSDTLIRYTIDGKMYIIFDTDFNEMDIMGGHWADIFNDFVFTDDIMRLFNDYYGYNVKTINVVD